MKRIAIVMLAAFVAACGGTDANGGRGAAMDTTEVHPVQLDTLAWFNQSGTVHFDGRAWIIAGEPVIDPVVERVGEYQGTPLYAEVNTMEPYNALYVPLEDDYWQMLEEAPPASDTVPAPDTVPPDTVGAPDTAGAGEPQGG